MYWNGPLTPCPPVGFHSWWGVPEDHEAREELVKFRRKLHAYVLSQRTVRPWWKRMFGGGRYQIPLFTHCAVEVLKEEGLLENPAPSVI